MTPIIICLCALAGILLWWIYTSVNTIKSMIVATIDLIVTAVIAMLAIAAFYGLMSVIMNLVTDPSLWAEYLKGLLIAVVGIVICCVGVYFLGSILLALLGWVWNIIEFFINIILFVFEWVEEKSQDGFEAMLKIILNRVSNEGKGGDSR